MQLLDPEPLMDDTVRAAGGRCVRELVGPSACFDNADYLFPDDNVVAELKSLEKDFLSDPAIGEEMHLMYNRWLSDGKDVPLIFGTGLLRTDDLPIECARELVGIFKERFATTVLRKANRQIRETKEHLKYCDAVGVLLLSNEGNFVFDPAMMAHVLLHSLRTKFSSIEHVILFSANHRITSATSGSSGPPFISIRFPNRRQPRYAFLERLGSCWYEVLGAATNQHFPAFHFAEPTAREIDQLRFQ